MRIQAFVGASTLALALALAVPAGAAPVAEAVPAPPGPDAARATNAMLRPADVPASLAQMPPGELGGFRTGYTTSFENDDPVPVCSSPDGLSVFPTIDGALVYQASSGDVAQYMYVYPSQGAATKAWSRLTKDLQSACNGAKTLGGLTNTASTAAIPGLAGGQGWGVSSSIGTQYTAAHQLGDAIQYVTIGDIAATDKSRQSAVRNLASTLAGRWLGRADLPLTQDASITRGTRTMLQASDIGAATPITPPGPGAGVFFNAAIPGGKPSPCRNQGPQGTSKLRAASTSLMSMQGATDPRTAGGGYLIQRMYVYESAAAAQAAWSEVRQALSSCARNAGRRVPVDEQFWRVVTGESSMTFDGVPGLWLRDLSVYPAEGASEPSSSQSGYTIDLLIGNAIQRLIYVRTLAGQREVPIDQAAVNALAAQLALRWQAGNAAG